MKAVAAFMLVLCYLACSHAWNCTEGPQLSGMQQIDAGLGKVVATTKYNQAYMLVGSSWYSLGSVWLKHVSVGPAGLWGVSTSHRVYKSVGGNMLQSSSSSQQVDAGGDGQVVGVYTSYSYCLNETSALAYKGVGSLHWKSLRRSLRYLSCSPNNGCWGVDSSYRVYFTQMTSNCSASGWSYVSGQSMTMIEVGTDGSVFGVNRSGKVYQRLGISSSRPNGTFWQNVPVCLTARHVSYDLGRLWVVTPSGFLLQCTH